jgi:hypothetical protein
LADVNVIAAAANHISFSEPATVTAGVPFPITVTIQDAYNNTVPTYTDTVHFTATNGAQANYTFQPADQGQRTFNIALDRAQTLGVTGTDTATGITGNTSFTVVAAAADHFAVSAPSGATAWAPFAVTLTAQDAYGNTVTGYTGTVHFSSADPYGASLPPDYTFQAADQGVATFSGVTLYTAGTWDVTATDTSSGISGAANVAVTPAAADHLVFLQPPTDTPAGQTLSPVMVAIVDAYGNVETADNSDAVTLTIGVDPSSGTATLSGTLTVMVVNGVATFGDLSIDTSGAGYTLHATVGGGLPDIDSGPFNII